MIQSALLFHEDAASTVTPASQLSTNAPYQKEGKFLHSNTSLLRMARFVMEMDVEKGTLSEAFVTKTLYCGS